MLKILVSKFHSKNIYFQYLYALKVGTEEKELNFLK